MEIGHSLVEFPLIEMMHLHCRAISRLLNGRTRTATFTEVMVAGAAADDESFVSKVMTKK